MSTRIRHLQAQEVVEVTARLSAARDALQQAEAQQAAWFGKTTQADDWLGQAAKKQAGPEKREDVASWNLKEVRRAFDVTVEALESWLRDGSDRFFPSVVAWDEGDESLTETLPALVAERQKCFGRYEATLADLRTQSMLVPPMRQVVSQLVTAVESQQRVEDVEVIPAVLSGQRTTTSQAMGRRAERYKTSDDVARSLRMARPAELAREPREPEPTGLFASIKKLFGG